MEESISIGVFKGFRMLEVASILHDTEIMAASHGVFFFFFGTFPVVSSGLQFVDHIKI